jgi:arylsulfatase A-like enzyme
MIKKRKNILYAILVFFILIGCKKIKENEAVQIPLVKKPNIIFIMADDLGYADLGCYGQKIIQTPNIDKLAKEGMRFTQTYSGSSVCAPARSVLMTGMHTGHTRVRGNFGLGGVKGLAGIEGRVPIMAEDVTVAEVLKSVGYRTGMIGKWGLGEPNTEGEPNIQGFDEFYGFLNQRRAHSYYPDYVWKNREKVMLTGNSDRNGTDYTHDIFANEAIEFIDRNQNDPFFLYLPLCIPHSNYELPDLGIYKDKQWDADAKAYAAMISLMDVTVGRIMQKLKESGIDENTIVFFTSDNGAAESSQIWKVFESNAPLRGVKRDPYEGGIRVPMIVRYPTEIAQGEINDLPWYFADVLPTLAELTGVSVPEGIDGTSVLATLKGGKQDLSNREMYWEFYEKDGWRAVRFGDWKAIQRDMHKKEHQPIEIYNIKNDISEINNLAAKYPELVEKAKHIFEESHIPSEHYVWKHLKK